MKKLLPVLILTTLVACGGNSGGSQTNAEKMQEISKLMIDNTKRGMVKIMTDSGSENDIDLSDGKAEVKSKNINKVTTETVLKIEGSLVYILSEEEDNASGTTSRKVDLEDMNVDMGPANDFFKNLNITKDENSMYISGTIDNSWEYEGTKLEALVNITAVISLSKPCSSSHSAKDLSQVLTVNGLRKSLPLHERNSISKCGKTLSNNELKALDLKNIMFCDTRSEDYSCQRQDMSNLTSDL